MVLLEIAHRKIRTMHDELSGSFRNNVWVTNIYPINALSTPVYRNAQSKNFLCIK